MKKFERKDKNEKRRLALEKQSSRRVRGLGCNDSNSFSIKTIAISRRLLAVFIAIVITISGLVVGFDFFTKAEEYSYEDADITVTNKSDSYLELTKVPSRNEDGTYKLDFTAYTTGDVTSELKTEKIPTDFVVIVDQSGSMAKNDMPTGYSKVDNVYLEDINNDRYYYYDSNTDQYYRVYAKTGNLYYKYPKNTYYGDDLYGASFYYWFSREKSTAAGGYGYYYYDDETNNYYPISLTVRGVFLNYQNYYSYVKNGSSITLPRNDGREYHSWRAVQLGSWYDRWDSVSDKLAFDAYKRFSGYTGLYYRDFTGQEFNVPTVDGVPVTGYCNSSGSQAVTELNGNTRMAYNSLYRGTGNNRRLDELKTALNSFASAVASETDSYGSVDNKIAIVGFSCQNSYSGSVTYPYNNTEVLTGTSLDPTQNNLSSNTSNQYFPNSTNYNGPQLYDYSTESGSVSGNYKTSGNAKGSYLAHVSDDDYAAYKNALVNASQINGDTTEVNSAVANAINAVTAYGGTQPEDGFEMAYGILTNRSEDTYTFKTGEKKDTTVPRNQVVIFFTDGRPGNYDTSNQYQEANDVVAEAKRVKGLGASVFTIGVFDESDGNPLTYSFSGTYTDQEFDSEHDSEANLDPHVFEPDYVKKDNVTQTDIKNFFGRHDYYEYTATYYYRYWKTGYPSSYGETANDTIFDYMSTVSSNYPDADGFVPLDSNGELSIPSNSTYESKCNELRHQDTSSSDNIYYRMAANQESLVAAFLDIITTESEQIDVSTASDMGEQNAFLRDVIGENFEIPQNANDLEITAYTEVGTVTKDQVTQEEVIVWSGTRADTINSSDIHWNAGSNTIDIYGFDYGANYLAYNKPANSSQHTEKNQGKRLVVSISGLIPKQNAVGELETNADTSGVYKIVAEEGQTPTPEMINAFPVPKMYRYAYNLRETGVKTDDKFNIPFTRGGNGSDGIMVNYAGGSRSINNGYVWSEAKNGDAIYFETFDKDAYLKAKVPDTGLDKEQYDYHLSLIDANGTTAKDFNSDFDLPEDTSTIHVSNVSNTRTVIINEHTKGVEGEADYSSKNKQFPIQIKLTKADGVTLVDDEVTATITRKSDPDHPESVTLHFERGNGVEEVRLADGDSITFDTLKNYRLIVWEKEDDHENYLDSYVPDEDGETAGTGVIVIDDDNSKNVIDVINRLETNPDVESGFADSSNPSKALFIILAVIAILGGTGTGYVLWKKKDEFVEQ